MHGPEIVARTISELMPPDKKYGNRWQYQPRSDRHSKVACWAILFDLLLVCPALRKHVEAGAVGFGINHEMRDFKSGRKKDLDLVICTKGASRSSGRKLLSLKALAQKYAMELTMAQEQLLDELPELEEVPVGEVYIALEAKACMTAHAKALPRLYDELTSSHMTIHGSSDYAIAVGFVMVNASAEFLSPTSNQFCVAEGTPKYSVHSQPRDMERVVLKVMEIQRRSGTGESGFDALGLIAVSCTNDGDPIFVVHDRPAPQAGEILHYDAMIGKAAALYQARFPHE